MDIVSVFLIVIIGVCSFIYVFFNNAYKYWKKRGFPYLEPKFPKGNSKKFLKFTKNVDMETTEFYKEIKQRSWKFGGVYIVTRPLLILTDPDIIGDILARDFNYFVDRGFYYNDKAEPISAHLFALNSKDWRNMRVKLTPTFTSGKLKMMFNSILSHSETLLKAFDNHVKMDEDIDIKDLTANYTTDVIGSCAFGLEMKSFDENEAQFRKHGRLVFKPEGIIHRLKLTLCATSPNLFTFLGLQTLRRDCTEFFTTLVKQTVRYREQNKISRSDFLQLLIDMKNVDKSLTINQIVAQVFLFFVAGFDTSSSTMAFALYELARHPEIQERLRNDINEVLEKYNNEITYESVKEITYLQQVIDEALRLYPPLYNLTRVCIKDYKISNTDLVIEKGTSVIIPLVGLHRDPEYYPDPLKFDPERFSTDNKSQLHKFVHLPFGDGPRNCIGFRFGLTQAKIGLIQILKNFKISISPSTKMPLTLNENLFLIAPNDTLYLKAERVK